jgi:hypothetical protein
MPISRIAPPKQSLAKLGAALRHFISLKDQHKRWMNLLPSSVVAKQVLYPHPLYNVRLTEVLAGKSLHLAMRRIGWIYFLRDRGSNLACAEVSSIRGVHKNARLTEGPFVRRTFELISKSSRDSRIGQRRFEMRSIRAESLHFFCLWFKAAGGIEYFIPVTPLGTTLKAKRWVSRTELAEALLREALRVRDAYARADSLSKNH